jgi:hypothetical protein
MRIGVGADTTGLRFPGGFGMVVMLKGFVVSHTIANQPRRGKMCRRGMGNPGEPRPAGVCPRDGGIAIPRLAMIK